METCPGEEHVRFGGLRIFTLNGAVLVAASDLVRKMVKMWLWLSVVAITFLWLS